MKVLSYPELAAFCGQLSMILKSGISSLEGISIMMEDAENEAEKELLSAMYEEMLTTGLFSQALIKVSCFPSYMVQMVIIGEETGNLDNVMESLASYYDREHSISKSIKSAVFYPLIMIGMMLCIIIILLTKVLPVFQQVFAQLGHEMTGLSGTVIQFGASLSDHSFTLILIAVLAILLTLIFARNRSRFLPQKLQDQMNACRLAEAMSLALRSGMTPEHGLDYAKKVIEHPSYLQKIDLCSQKLSEGILLNNALQETGLFTGIYARMISIAGRTGSTDEIMAQIADRYEEEIYTKITGYIAALEPTLVIILSVIVGVILLSVMLPLAGILAVL